MEINKDNTNIHDLFVIYKEDLSDLPDLQIPSLEPHRHHFEELIIAIEGEADHFIDFEEHHLHAPFISFITQGKLHRVRLSAKNSGFFVWLIRFQSDFIAETTFQLYSSFHDNANVWMAPGTCFNRLDILCRMMYDEYQTENPDYAVLRQLLSAVFGIIESERRKLNLKNEESKKIHSETFRNFLRILEDNYKEQQDVDFYAEKLFMTSRNLNKITREILHMSVSDIIETRRLTEAKNLLLTTGKPISDIGFELGFNEKTYFTHAFKRKTGQTPSEFRKEMSHILGE